MATAGYTTIGATAGSTGTANGTNNPAGLLITMPESGSITKVTAYIDTVIAGVPLGSGTTVCKIYTGTAGAVSSLVATTNTNTFNGTAAWVDFTLASAFPAAATTYWLQQDGLGGGGPATATGRIYLDTGGAANTGYFRDDGGTPAYNTNQFSLYATYTPDTPTGGFNIALV